MHLWAAELNLVFLHISGIARGCGWQDLGAYVNLGAYYLCGLPVAAILGFWLQMSGQGLWIGILVGASVQALLLSIITSCTNWEKQARQGRECWREDLQWKID
ncbi:protein DETOXIFICATION 10-like [Quercus lobata]|uniref:protein DETOXIFICATION 10-like n=1 Tax=Quercus lobata TaxID=97700 RepID=UPI0012459C33|nr:protein DETOXIFICATION 10-like [Quercus lobata]